MPPSHRRPAPRLDRERAWWAEGAVVAGVDEVGRGAWAGPVTYAAVVLPTDRRVYKLRDSKTLDPAAREHLARRLRGVAPGIGIGHASNREIDRLGMSLAMRLAARRAVEALPDRPDVLLLDGNWDFLADFPSHNERLIGGDARCASIAAASIVAKAARDSLMRHAEPRFPPYDFASNKGYPTPAHLASLDAQGPCELHRLSWRPVAAARWNATAPRLPLDEVTGVGSSAFG
ncbi:ribonuclease HII [Egibacter rhizosphaerae]|uniref:ribonuclease HII n=1 Tax=Egibacter rhizosphaerae TaxID=1670831 RepID=UPI0013F14AE7|nr:ribonuclease HII [Egibacter rhizosphaerae]